MKYLANAQAPSFNMIFNFPDVNECDFDPPVCQNGGTCEDSEGGYTCMCTPEWSGRDCDTCK